MFGMLVLVGLAATGMLAVAGAFVFRESRRAQVLDRRLAGVRKLAVAVFGEPEQRHKTRASTESLYLVWAGILNVAAMLVPVGAAERAKLRQLITKAGFRHPDALSAFMTIKLVATVAGGVLVGFQTVRGQWLGEYDHTAFIVLAGLVGAVAGGMLPEMALRRLGVRRHRRMAAALPDALDLMTLCLESGLTFERTLSRVVQELRPLAPDLARELALVEAELRLGADRKVVLHELYKRAEVDGLRDLATTIVQGERYGTPLAQSMQNIAANERMQRAARVAAQIERLPVLMSLPMLLLVTPGTLLLVAGPGFLIAMQALSTLGG